jgi:hypothetical protein
MSEALDEIVGCLTSPDFKHRMVVVLAGYTNDMALMLETNQGLTSRFTESVRFPDFDKEAVYSLAQLLLAKDDPKLRGVGQKQDELRELCARLVVIPKFSNGRDVETWVAKARRVMALASKQRKAVVTLEHLRIALEDMVAKRNLTTSALVPVNQDLAAAPSLAQMPSTSSAPPLRQRSRTSEAPAGTETDLEITASVSPLLMENMFGNVDGATIACLQDFIDQYGLASKENVARLRNDPDLLEQVKNKLMNDHGYSADEATDQLNAWSTAQDDLEVQLEELDEQEKNKTLLQIPIWECQVCGRARRPYIACYVAPAIVDYLPVEV